jgi:diguanylate cyclase (GGDEF)-like protein/PAS domain S-box-containing protein
MLNILIIDNDNNNSNYWHQQLNSLELDRDEYILTVDNLETVKKNQPQIKVDCIWYSGDINNHIADIEYLQICFTHTPIFKVKKSNDTLLIDLFLSTDNKNINLDQLVTDSQAAIYNDTQSKAEIEFQGIVSCISDAILIYTENEILFSNALSQILMENTNNEALSIIKENEIAKKTPIVIHENNNACTYQVHYVPTVRNNKKATMVILNNITEQEKERTEFTLQIQDHVDAFTKINTELDKNQTRLQLILKSAGEGFWDWHIHKGEVFLSHRWKEMLGYQDDDISDTFNDWANLIHPDDLGSFLLKWSQFMENDLDCFNVEYRILCENGCYTWVEARGVKEVDKNGKANRLAGSHIDINKRKKIETELNQHRDDLEEMIAARTKELEKANRMLEGQAKLDGLTELANRRCLDETLEQEVLRAHRDNQNLCVLMLDIDYFKFYNDTFGHQEGDHCLKIVAKTISDSLMRPSDMVGRYGGEEFSAILPSTNIDGGLLIAQQISANIARIKTLKQNPHTGLPLSLSIGVACSSPDKRLSPEELIRASDDALYKAKEQGRNCIVCHK